jgi:3-phosphoglycerate kinase
VPIKNGQVTDINRIKESLPTINYLLGRGVKLIVASHLGRPKKPGDEETSMIPVALELEKLLGRPLKKSNFVIGEETDYLAGLLRPGEALIIENLRWCAGEEAGSDDFARELAKLADVYINDAFAVSHRPHASVYTITKYLPSYAGFLIEKETKNLSKLLEQPPKPFIIIMGGAKIADKIGVIDNLAQRVDKILIGGAMANTFLAAEGQEMSKSLYEPEVLGLAKEYLKKYRNKIILPEDKVKDQLADGFSYMDIGPKTIERYLAVIKSARTVFWNGNMGFSEEKRFALGTNAVAQAIAENQDCFSVVAGGDTVGAINALGVKPSFSFVSTGGGAALEFLAGKELPGVEALEE